MGGQGGIKRHGIISCDSCGRDFSSREADWSCTHCGFDNAVAMRERGKHSYSKIGQSFREGLQRRDAKRLEDKKKAGGE